MSDPRSKSSLLIVFLVVFIDLLGFGIVLPLLPRYGDYFQADRWMLGSLMASFSAMQFLFAPVWGRLSDRIGRRPVLMLGLAGSVIFYGMFGYISSWAPDVVVLGLGPIGWMMVSRIGAGIAGATIPTAQAYIADCTTERDRGKGMALIGAAFGMGFTFGPLLAAAFASNDVAAPPSSGPGYLASGLSAIALLGAVFRLPESLRPDSKPSERRWMNPATLLRALRRPAIGPLLLTMFLVTFAFAQFESTLSLLTEAIGMSEKDNFLIFAYLGFVLTLAQGLLVRRLLPRIGEYRCAVLGATLLMVGLLLMGVMAQGERQVELTALEQATGQEEGGLESSSLASDSDQNAASIEATSSGGDNRIALLFGIMPISIVGFAAMNPSLQSLLSLHSSSADQGGILGLGQSMSAMARILGPLAGVALIKSDLRYPYWSAAATMVVGVLLVMSLKANQTSTSGMGDSELPGSEASV